MNDTRKNEIIYDDNNIPIPEGYELIVNEGGEGFEFNGGMIDFYFLLSDAKRIGWQEEDILEMIKGGPYLGIDYILCFLSNVSIREVLDIEKWGYIFFLATIYREIKSGDLFAPVLYFLNNEDNGRCWDWELYRCSADNLSKFPVAVLKAS